MSFNKNTDGGPASTGTKGPLFFAEHFLRVKGAVVERDESGLDALIPGQLRDILHTGEYIRISDDAGDREERPEHYRINYGSPLLDRMVSAALHRVPFLSCLLEFTYVKSGGFERLIGDQFSFYGASAGVETVADVTSDYLLVSCRYRAQSDEQKEGLLKMAFNLESKKFVPDMADMLESAGCGIVFTTNRDIGEMDILHRLFDPIRGRAKKMLSNALEPFQAGMSRRFKRDVNNLEQYYAGLETEMRKNLEKPTLSDNARADRLAKIAALPAEFKRKADDLFKKYSIRVEVEPVAAMIIRTPAKKIVCKLSIGRKEKRIFLTYNPVTRAMEPLECAICGKSIMHVHFNAGLKPVCFECGRQAR